MRFGHNQYQTPDPVKLISSTKFNNISSALEIVSPGVACGGGSSIRRIIHAISTMATNFVALSYLEGRSLLLGLGWLLLYGQINT